MAETFLSENFDASGLLALSGLLAQSMRLVPESIAIGESGKASGRLELGSLRGSYTIEGASYRIQLEAWSTRAPFFMRAITLDFTETNGAASDMGATVQFHPLSTENATDAIGDREQLVGWSLEVDPIGGTTARPTTMKAIGAGWRIGNATEAFPEQSLPGIRDGTCFDQWLERLRPQRERR